MSSAQYIGRVGGLAVALGVGAAILAGAGAAAAESESESGDPGSAATQSAPDSAAPPAPVAAAVGPDSSGDSDRDTAEQNAPAEAKVSASGGANTEVRGSSAGDADENDGADKDADKDSEASAAKAATEAAADVSSVTSVVSVASTEPAPAASALELAAPVHDSGTTVAAARHEDAPTALVAPTAAPAVAANAGYAPEFDLVNGVITGDVPDGPPAYYTVISGPVNGGKVTFDASGNGDLTFLPDASQLTGTGTDRFQVMVSEKSALVQWLESIPELKPFVKPIVVQLHRIPIVGFVLSPIIGAAHASWVDVNVGEFVGGPPIAFTTKITSFDGVQISVNYFPKVGLTETGPNSEAPTILNGPSLATAGYTDPNQLTTVFGLVPGLSILRQNYNVVTWDPRGEFASGGRLHLDSELFEAKDVSAIIDWVSTLDSTKLEGGDGPANPLLGMVGGSYGGGIQLTSAGIDDRIDAISPGIAWNNLLHTLYPNDAFKTSWASLLLLSLVVSGSRLDPQIYAGISTGVLFGTLFGPQRDFLSANSPDTVTDRIDIPTLFLQGTVDTLFPLNQAMTNAEQILAAHTVPMKMVWYCGGHGKCLDPVDLDQQTTYLTGEIMDWMDAYVMNKGTPYVDDETFTWVDQDGNWWYSGDLPTDEDFYSTPYEVPGTTGGLLPIVPVLGGSGPQNTAGFPVSLVSGAKVEHGALNLTVDSPSTTEATYVVGKPSLTLTYSGIGTSRNIYAQLVDNTTGRVLGNIVSPIPVVLNGTRQEITVDMEAIAYTMEPGEPGVPGDQLTLQIFDSATSFENFTSYGLVHIESVSLTLPRAADVEGLEMADI